MYDSVDRNHISFTKFGFFQQDSSFGSCGFTSEFHRKMNMDPSKNVALSIGTEFLMDSDGHSNVNLGYPKSGSFQSELSIIGNSL